MKILVSSVHAETALFHTHYSLYSPTASQFSCCDAVHLGSPMVSSVRVSPLDPVEKDSVKAVKALEVEED